jgi:hypothetical protein
VAGGLFGNTAYFLFVKPRVLNIYAFYGKGYLV